MPARHRRPAARRISKAERRDCLVGAVADRVRPDATDEQISAGIHALLFGPHSYVQHMAFSYYVSSSALRTTKLSEAQLKRLYRDIRKAAERAGR